MANKKLVVNIFGGPGVGKSILTSDIFSALKKEFISCDISYEYIKKKLREKAMKAIESQIYIFAKQQFQLFTMKDEVDIIITDSPLLFCTIYDKTDCPFLKGLIMKEHNKYDNLNYLLGRDTSVPYEQEGRYQDINGAKNVDSDMKNFLTVENIPFKSVNGIGQNTIDIILKDVREKLAQIV